MKKLLKKFLAISMTLVMMCSYVMVGSAAERFAETNNLVESTANYENENGAKSLVLVTQAVVDFTGNSATTILSVPKRMTNARICINVLDTGDTNSDWLVKINGVYSDLSSGAYQTFVYGNMTDVWANGILLQKKDYTVTIDYVMGSVTNQQKTLWVWVFEES